MITPYVTIEGIKEFERNKTGFGYMVYDNQFEGTGGSTVTDLAIPYYGGSATGTNPCYTLLFDNWDHRQHDKVGGPESQHPVYVALEFKNESGEDFWGQNNLIPKDGYFYITGKLDPDAPVGTVVLIFNVADAAVTVEYT